jgi:hypothetical protein
MNDGSAALSDGQYGRRVGRALLVIALVIIALGAFFVVAKPGFMGGPGPWDGWVEMAGATGLLVGFFWMLRIHRANPEPDHRNWRYRSRR